MSYSSQANAGILERMRLCLKDGYSLSEITLIGSHAHMVESSRGLLLVRWRLHSDDLH